jgi:hypothetical protein
MSLHIDCDYGCRVCGLYFVPYAADITCPGCGEEPADLCEDYIDRIVDVMRRAWKDEGRLTPRSLAPWTIGEQVLACVCAVLDHAQGPDEIPAGVSVFWNGNASLVPHIAEVALLAGGRIDQSRTPA